MPRALAVLRLALFFTLSVVAPLAAQEPVIDLSAYRPDNGISVSQTGSQLRVSWPFEERIGRLDLDLRELDAHAAASNSSRPMSMRRISWVPAPIS